MTKLVKDLNIGDVIREGDSFTLLVSSLDKRKTRAEKDFLSLSFSDNSGQIEGNLWNIPFSLTTLADQYEQSQLDDSPMFLKVIGDVVDYQGKKQLNIQNLIVIDSSLFTVSDFLPSSEYSSEALWNGCRDLVKSVEDPEYNALINAVLMHDNKMYLNGLLTHIAALKHHHNYCQGLIEHSLQVVHTALGVADQPFGFNDLNRDLIKVGGLLHDIGKIEEYSISSGFKMNPYGVDHRYAGVSILDRVVREQKVDISPAKLKMVKNIIMSHHGEYGDPNVRYESPEAELLHFCDNISARMNKQFKK